jgi:predicted transcriptional regulator
MEKTTVYLTCDQQEQLAALARRTRRSKAELIREAVDVLLRDNPRPRPKSAGIWASDGEVNSENLEDWLAANWKRDW